MKKRREFVAWFANRVGKPPGWERMARRLVSPQSCRGMADLLVVRDGLSFLAQPSVPLGWNIVFLGSYERELRSIFRSLLREGCVAIDVGANVGWHTLLISALVGNAGRVLAVEPNPAVAGLLRDNVARNRLRNVEFVPYAMSDRAGVAEFFGPSADDPHSGDGHLVSPSGPAAGATIQVEMRQLDAIVEECQLERVDVIKIDVEGFEWPALLGARKTIDGFKPHVIFEYNSDYAGRSGGTAELLADFFEARGYRLFAIGQLGAQALKAGAWPGCADIWAVPPSGGAR